MPQQSLTIPGLDPGTDQTPARPGEGQPPRERCACFSLRRAARALTRHYDHALAPSGLRSTQFSALMAMRSLGPMTVGDLAERTVTDRTTLTRNLAVLEQRGLIAVEPGHDRRQRLAHITGQGRKALEAALPQWRLAQRDVRQRLGQARLDAFLDDLGDLTALFGPGAEANARDDTA